MCRKHRELLKEHRQLLKENRALRCLLYFQHDRELASLLSLADQNDSLEDVLRFVIWALERQPELIVLPDDQYSGPHVQWDDKLNAMEKGEVQ